MNIFYLDKDPVLAAQHACDTHVVKMPTEAAQLLCTAVNMAGGSSPYKTSHKNHPSAIWARSSRANFEWLRVHGIALCAEYSFRYHKTHKSLSILESLSQDLIPDVFATPYPPQCMPDFCKIPWEQDDGNGTVLAYRRLYNEVKFRIARWDNGRPAPYWYVGPSQGKGMKQSLLTAHFPKMLRPLEIREGIRQIQEM